MIFVRISSLGNGQGSDGWLQERLAKLGDLYIFVFFERPTKYSEAVAMESLAVGGCLRGLLAGWTMDWLLAVSLMCESKLQATQARMNLIKIIGCLRCVERAIKGFAKANAWLWSVRLTLPNLRTQRRASFGAPFETWEVWLWAQFKRNTANRSRIPGYWRSLWTKRCRSRSTGLRRNGIGIFMDLRS